MMDCRVEPGNDGALGGRRKHYRSALEQSHDRRFRERVEMQLEADHRRRRIRGYAKLALDRMDREKIAVRVVTFRGAGAAVSGNAEIGSGLQRSLRDLAAREVAGVERQLGRRGRA